VSVHDSDLDALHVAARRVHRLVTDERALDAATARPAGLGRRPSPARASAVPGGVPAGPRGVSARGAP